MLNNLDRRPHYISRSSLIVVPWLLAGGVGPNDSERKGRRMAMDGKTKTYRQREDNDILGRDPARPLAPPGGPKALLHPAPLPSHKWEHSCSQNLPKNLL